jgi:hypothetical protein
LAELELAGVVMNQNTALERAFELAKSGRCKSIPEIRKALKLEGYSLNQLSGRFLNKQLRALIEEAKRK